MAEVFAAIVSACVTFGKIVYDEMKRMREQAEDEIRRAVSCSDPLSQDDEDEPVKVDEKKPPVALMVIGAAVVAHVVRRATK